MDMTDLERTQLQKAIDDLKAALAIGRWDKRINVHTIRDGHAAFLELSNASLSIESSHYGYAVSVLSGVQ